MALSATLILSLSRQPSFIPPPEVWAGEDFDLCQKLTFASERSHW